MLKKFLVFSLFVGFIVACSSSGGGDGDGDGGGTVVDNFDRGAMLTHIADNIIIPAYQDFSSQMTLLEGAAQAFNNSPNTFTLEALRTAWYNTYVKWQNVELFNIGKAEELQYAFYMNIYPVNVTDVENNIANGGYDLNSVNNQDAVGFPALDYLLHGVATNDNDIIAKFSTDANAQGYRTYLMDVVNQMDGLTEQVLNDWSSSYRNTFVSNDGNTTTSSVNMMVNVFVEYYERKLRANKFGIPAGVFSGGPLPDRVEALYRGNVSKDLALQSLQTVEDFFNGKNFSNSSTGESFRTYLAYLQRNDITTSIIDQFAAARVQIISLMDNFNQQVISDNSQMLMAYDELQKAVVYLKNDMPSAFNVTIIFIDNDGD